MSLNSTKVAEGHKVTFCLEDAQCNVRGARRHHCGCSKQGISKNCGDLYGRYLDCQWIDITGVPEGIYSIQLKVNPTQLVPESDYSNNAIQCTVSMDKEYVLVCIKFFFFFYKIIHKDSSVSNKALTLIEHTHFLYYIFIVFCWFVLVHSLIRPY